MPSPDPLDGPPAWRRYLRFWKPDVAADVDEELRFHIESRIADYLAAGMSPREAHRAAAARFGDVQRVRDVCRTLGQQRENTMRRTEWLGALRLDLRYGARQLLKHPMFTVIAAFTIALGIGANSAIFSVLDAVLLRPLPYANADRIMDLKESWRGEMGVSVGNYESWRAEVKSFAAIGAVEWGEFTLTGSGAPEPLHAAAVTASLWRVLHMRPVLGRYFLPDEDRPGHNHVVVLSHALWQQQFGADSTIIGREITLDGTKYTIIGIAPSDYFPWPGVAELMVPLALTPTQIANHADHELAVYGLLKPGVTRDQAFAELTRIEARLAAEYPHSYTDGRVFVRSFKDSLVRDSRTMLLIMAGAVGFVLLITCANVANLLLVRATSRERELAIRAALGAGRARVVRQLRTESITLALVGGCAGLVLAHFSIRLLIAAYGGAGGAPRLASAGLDAATLAFTVALTVGCGIVFGIAPALRASRPDLQTALKESGGRAAVQEPSRDWLRNALVVAEIALALVLLVGAGLLVRSALILQHVDPGFNPHGAALVWAALPKMKYPTPEEEHQVFTEILDAARALPGVRSATLVSTPPLTQGGGDFGLFPEGHYDSRSMVEADIYIITPGYFRTLHIPLVAGRAFSDHDAAGSPPVII